MADSLAIAPIQITMIISLGAVFGIKVTEGMAKGLLSTFAAGYLGRGVSQLLVGWIPGIGNIINTATAAGITEALGWIAVKHFRIIKEHNSKTTKLKIDIKSASAIYENKFKKQIDSFIAQKVIRDNQIDEYRILLDDYRQFLLKLELNEDNYSEENAKDFEYLKERLSELVDLTPEYDSSDA
jgi:uncharacterized protein (DUF697 family)